MPEPFSNCKSDHTGVRLGIKGLLSSSISFFLISTGTLGFLLKANKDLSRLVYSKISIVKSRLVCRGLYVFPGAKGGLGMIGALKSTFLKRPSLMFIFRSFALKMKNP